MDGKPREVGHGRPRLDAEAGGGIGRRLRRKGLGLMPKATRRTAEEAKSRTLGRKLESEREKRREADLEAEELRKIVDHNSAILEHRSKRLFRSPRTRQNV